jgi:hypothetical protein
VDITAAHMERIESTDQHAGVLPCSLCECSGRWRPRAMRAGRLGSADVSVLDGIPIAIKDVLCTTDMVTTAGSRILEGWTPAYDATVVRKLREAGLVPLGKTNMDEFAMGSSTEHSGYHVTREPLGPHEGPRRLWGWLCGRCGGQAGPGGHWERYRRLYPPTGGLHWHCRGEAHLRRCKPLWRYCSSVLARSGGSGLEDRARFGSRFTMSLVGMTRMTQQVFPPPGPL